MKRDDTKKNFTALSGNDLATVHLHYLSFSCFIALVTFSEVCGVMRYRSVINAPFHFFAPRTVIFSQKCPIVIKMTPAFDYEQRQESSYGYFCHPQLFSGSNGLPLSLSDSRFLMRHYPHSHKSGFPSVE